MKPTASITIKGEIEDFTRIDNVYKSFKREGMKFLSNAEITVTIDYTERFGTQEIPE